MTDLSDLIRSYTLATRRLNTRLALCSGTNPTAEIVRDALKQHRRVCTYLDSLEVELRVLLQRCAHDDDVKIEDLF